MVTALITPDGADERSSVDGWGEVPVAGSPGPLGRDGRTADIPGSAIGD